MKANRLLFVAIALSVAGIFPSQAGPLGPGGPTAVQKTTAVDSATQSQLNATAYFVMPVIGQVIQQTLQGMANPGTRLADGWNGLDATTRGMSAGDDAWPWQVWAEGSGGHSKNSLAVGGYDLDNYGSQVGIQTQITPTVLLGVSVSWQGSNGSLNGGFTSRSSTFGVAPYAGWQFSEHWNISAIAGYNGGDNTLDNPGSAYSGKYQSSQWNLQGALNGSYIVGAVRLSPTVSLLYMQTHNNAFVDSTGATVAGSRTALTRGSAGGSVSLPMTGWEPYLRAGAEYDFSVPTGGGANGNAGGTIGVGTTVAITQAIWMSFDAGYNSLGRTGLALWAASGRVNLRF